MVHTNEIGDEEEDVLFVRLRCSEVYRNFGIHNIDGTSSPYNVGSHVGVKRGLRVESWGEGGLRLCSVVVEFKVARAASSPLFEILDRLWAEDSANAQLPHLNMLTTQRYTRLLK